MPASLFFSLKVSGWSMSLSLDVPFYQRTKQGYSLFWDQIVVLLQFLTFDSYWFRCTAEVLQNYCGGVLSMDQHAVIIPIDNPIAVFHVGSDDASYHKDCLW
ncbi:unnamed protein product [Urochloa humidicola]